MFQRLLLIGLLIIGAVAILGAEAHAISIPSGYTITTKGVQCKYDAAGTGNTPTTGYCDVSEVTEGILFCLNPSNQKVSGESASQPIEFFAGASLGSFTKKNGRTHYDSIANAAGVVSINAEPDPATACADSEECTLLRESCVNPNWVPVDVIPISMCVALTVFQCSSSDPEDCPCDPTLGSANQCVDLDNSTLTVVDPWVTKKLSCALSNSGNLKFGDTRQYTCVDATLANGCL